VAAALVGVQQQEEVAAAQGSATGGEWPADHHSHQQQQQQQDQEEEEEEEAGTCSICMDRRVALSVSSCAHGLCLPCAYQLCAKARAAPLCPFCRRPIEGFSGAAA
jgi:hypothetical protein